jgi:hypothetical protein
VDKIVVDVDRIMEKVSPRTDRTKVSLYLSKKLFTAFKKKCGNASASKVMEELMDAYVSRSPGRNT